MFQDLSLDLKLAEFYLETILTKLVERGIQMYRCFFDVPIPASSQFKYKLKKRRCCAWGIGPGNRMVSADGSSELWQLPLEIYNLAFVFTFS